jgi:adenosylmethionine-8-amino-7-oxononanoate aminotransferase
MSTEYLLKKWPALASINIFNCDSTLLKMALKSDIIYNTLCELPDMPHVGNMRCRGMMARLEVVQEIWKERMGWKVARYMRRRGVIIRPLGNILVIMPPLVTSGGNLTLLMETLNKSVRCGNGIK